MCIRDRVLRLVGYGPVLDFVVPRLDRGARRIMGINPQAWRRFHPVIGRTRQPVRFAPWREFIDPKPPGTFRVMFMGESTVEGYPHEPNGAAPAFLQAMLQRVWPDRPVEVINCGVTAINSWSLRAWARELLRCEPDLLVIYAGHNEFYGGYGAASLRLAPTSRLRVRSHIWLRDLKLARLLEDVVGAVGSGRDPARGPIMEQLARGRHVPLDGPLYAGCRENFRVNLEDIARAARSAGVPLLLCSLVSNERDLVPMASLHRPGLAPESLAAWQAHHDAGLAAVRTGDWNAALAAFSAAAGIDDRYAEIPYYLAQAHDRLGDAPQAQTLYRRARDLDALRFRATAEFSEVIRDVAARHGALFADVRPAFESASPQGLIGWNLMTDHLHPTVFGHYLIARTILETLAAAAGDRWPPLETGRLPGFQSLAEELGNDDLSEAVALIKIRSLAMNFPFAGTPNAILASRLDEKLGAWHAGLDPTAAAGYGEWLKKPDLAPPHYFVGLACLRAGRIERAITMLGRAERMCEPHSLQAARCRAALVRARLAAASEEAASKPARQAAEDFQTWLIEAAAMHPDRRADFDALRSEVQAALAGARK